MIHHILSFLFPVENNDALLDKGQKMQTARFRAMMVAFAIFVCFFYIIQRIITLSIDSNNIYKPQGFNHGDAAQYRGNLYDRNGEILATDITTYELLVNTKKLQQDPYKLAAQLHEIIADFDKERFIQYAKQNKGWHVLHNRITPKQRLDILYKGMVGIEFKHNYTRIYPYQNMTSYFTGYLSQQHDNKKKFTSGLEKALFDQLEQGHNITTSLDIRMQYSMYNRISQAMYHYKAKAAAGLLLKLDTMEVLSMVSLPDFDPNFYYKTNNWLNRTTQGGFEPGSTFKLINSAIAIESGAVSLQTTYDATKPLQYGRYRINDYHAKNRILTTPEIFIYSSNIGSAKMALYIDADTHKNKILALGLNEKLPIILPEHTSARAPKKWSDIYRITTSYGHGLRVTPLHIVTAAAAAINDGLLREPKFVKQDSSSSIHDDADDDALQDVIFSASTINDMRRLMRLNVLKGSGKKANIKGMMVGGKTGTSEKSINGLYQDDKLISSFLASFPINKPEYILYVMLDEPQEVVAKQRPTGGVVAAPLVGDIINDIKIFLSNLPLSDDQMKHIDKRLYIALPEPDILPASY